MKNKTFVSAAVGEMRRNRQKSSAGRMRRGSERRRFARRYGRRGRGGRFQLPDAFAELREEQRRGHGHGDEIGDRLGEQDGGRLVFKQQRTDIDQRNEQNDLAQHGEKQRAFGVADGDKGLLAGELNAEQQRDRHIDAERGDGKGDERGVVIKDHHKRLRRNLHRQPQRRRIGDAGEQQQPKGPFDALGVPRPVVIADDRLRALRQPDEREHGKLHHARQNRHRADGRVAAVLIERGVEADGDDALGRLHDKRREAEREAGEKNFRREAQTSRTQPQRRLFAGQEQNDPDRRDRLRQNRRQRRAAHAHIKRKDKDRVEHDVAQRADQNGEHTGFRKALRGDKGVEAEGELHKKRPGRVDAHIRQGVLDGIRTRAERQQQRLGKDQKHDGERGGHADEQNRAVAERFFGAGFVALAEKNRGARRPAHADKGRERGNEHNQRQADADAGQRVLADDLDMADVHAVDNVIEQVDDLRGDRRHGQPEEQLSDALGAKRICLIAFHTIKTPFLHELRGRRKKLRRPVDNRFSCHYNSLR